MNAACGTDILLCCLGAELQHLLPLVPVLVAITGRVWCKTPIKCALSDEEGAIVHVCHYWFGLTPLCFSG